MDTTVKAPIEMPEVERLEPIHTKGLQRVFTLLRLAMGWTFLWAFLDKAFALGFSTGRVVDDAGATVKIAFFGDAAWIHGASPTAGVLGFALKGPFTHFYQTITGYQITQAGPTSADCRMPSASFVGTTQQTELEPEAAGRKVVEPCFRLLRRWRRPCHAYFLQNSQRS